MHFIQFSCSGIWSHYRVDVETNADHALNTKGIDWNSMKFSWTILPMIYFCFSYPLTPFVFATLSLSFLNYVSFFPVALYLFPSSLFLSSFPTFLARVGQGRCFSIRHTETTCSNHMQDCQQPATLLNNAFCMKKPWNLIFNPCCFCYLLLLWLFVISI